jgi:hypothetical protein
MKKITLGLLLALFSQAVFAQETESVKSLSMQMTTKLEAKLGFNWNFRFPFMQGGSPLTQGNNISVTPGVEISPVSLNFTANAVWTPVAFAEVSAGGRIGSGWNITFAGSPKRGIGLNIMNDDGSAKTEGSPLGGAHWELHGGAALQADLAAFFPGDWNHVVARTFHGIRYQAFSGAQGYQGWWFEDVGDNRNGFTYQGNLLVAYRMPIFLNMVGAQIEVGKPLDGKPDQRRWGGDIAGWTLSAVLGFKITDRLDMNLITQFDTKKNFTNVWDDDNREQHFEDLRIDPSNPTGFGFKRVVLAASYRL